MNGRKFKIKHEVCSGRLYFTVLERYSRIDTWLWFKEETFLWFTVGMALTVDEAIKMIEHVQKPDITEYPFTETFSDLINKPTEDRREDFCSTFNDYQYEGSEEPKTGEF